MATPVADAGIALCGAQEGIVVVRHILAPHILGMLGARVAHRHLVVVEKTVPRSGQQVGTYGKVEQSVIGASQVAMVHPHVVRRAEGNGILMGIADGESADNHIAHPLGTETDAIEHCTATQPDNRLVRCHIDIAFIGGLYRTFKQNGIRLLGRTIATQAGLIGHTHHLAQSSSDGSFQSVSRRSGKAHKAMLHPLCLCSHHHTTY